MLAPTFTWQWMVTETFSSYNFYWLVHAQNLVPPLSIPFFFMHFCQSKEIQPHTKRERHKQQSCDCCWTLIWKEVNLFQTVLKFSVLRWETLFTNGKHSGEMPSISGVTSDHANNKIQQLWSSMLNDSTVRRRLGKYSLIGKPLLSEEMLTKLQV